MKLKKIKNTLLVVLTLALVSAASVAITYAIVPGAMGEEENTFTNNPNISVSISENEWDNKGPDGNDTNPTIPESELGSKLAESYSTGMDIPKNPSLTNTSASVSNGNDHANADENRQEWVAMTVKYTVKFTNVYDASGNEITSTFTNKEFTYANYSDFAASLAKVGYNGTANTFNVGTADNNWTAADADNEIFYYNSILDSTGTNTQTSELFDTVKINSSFDTANVTIGGTSKGCYAIKLSSTQTVYTEQLPEFHIILKGYAVQADGITTKTAAQSALKDLIDNTKE